jgi:hypothetical protein
MSESQHPIKISAEDITEANRLSLSCPICASAVEKNVASADLVPVVCSNCHTLYHRTCWQQNGGQCATLGCQHKECYTYGTELGPLLKIGYSDLPRHVPRRPSPNGRSKQLKAEEKRRQREAERSAFWNTLLERIKRAIGWR